jgi:hypothetical protein
VATADHLFPVSAVATVLRVPDETPSVRFERSAIGQLVISAGIVLFLLIEIGTNLPESSVEREISRTANRTVRWLGVEQEWGVFAPDPRPTSLGVEGRVTFEDGSTAVWHLPQGGEIVENLRYYRWRKWLERIRSDGYPELYEPTARWIASLYDDQPSDVVRVELVRFFRTNEIDDPQPPYEEYTYFTYDVARSGS